MFVYSVFKVNGSGDVENVGYKPETHSKTPRKFHRASTDVFGHESFCISNASNV